jgi:hypothetical protein
MVIGDNISVSKYGKSNAVSTRDAQDRSFTLGKKEKKEQKFGNYLDVF